MKSFYRWSGQTLMLVVRDAPLEYRYRDRVHVLPKEETPARSVSVAVDSGEYHVAVDCLPELRARADGPASGVRMVNACRWCALVCTDGHDCRCCAVYSASGGYPESSENGHRRIMSVAEFFARHEICAALQEAMKDRGRDRRAS